MAASLSKVFRAVEEADLRDLVLSITDSYPEAASIALNYLAAERLKTASEVVMRCKKGPSALEGNAGLRRRSASIDSLLENAKSTAVQRRASRAADSPECVNGHQFYVHNYSRRTVCAHCNNTLAGVVRQGQQCSRCLINAHPECAALLPPCAGRRSKRSRRLKRKSSKKLEVPSPPSAASDVPSTSTGSPASALPPTFQLQRRSSHDLRLSTCTDDGEPDSLAPPSRASTASGGSAQQPTAHSDTGSDSGLPHSLDAGSDANSDEEEDWYEENSSSSSEGESDGEAECECEPGEGSEGAGSTREASPPPPGSAARKPSVDADELADTFSPLAQFKQRTRALQRHSASFRKRLSNSKVLGPEGVAKALSDVAALRKEYDEIPQNRGNIMHMPRFTEDKNRYFNILPNTHSRVLLPVLPDEAASDYINANWIRGFPNTEKEYIASQGPLHNTVDNYWRMIWQHQVHVIVMNTNLVENSKDKCLRYWPETPGPDGARTYRELKVTLLGEPAQPCEQYLVSRLLLEHTSGEARSMTHFWWIGWPDKGVPATSEGIGSYVLAVRRARAQSAPKAPVLVHCSAGVGRTGCFISIDIGMRQFDVNRAVDVLGTVCKLRQDRGLTVQTFSQYEFIHKVLLEYMQGRLALGEFAAAAALDVKAKRKSRLGTVQTAARPSAGMSPLLPRKHSFRSERVSGPGAECFVCGKAIDGQCVVCAACGLKAHIGCAPRAPLCTATQRVASELGSRKNSLV